MKIKIVSILMSCMAISNSYAVSSVLDFNYGFYNGSDFELNSGSCESCIDKTVKFYFKDEIVATPKKNNGISFFWNNANIVVNGKLLENGKLLQDENKKYSFSVIPKIESNLSYYNQSSIDYFSKYNLIIKGDLKNDQIVAKSIWPEDFALKNQMEVNQLKDNTIYDLVKNSKKEFSTQLLWSKNNQKIDLKNKNTLAFILNGAQGDDDEAHGGHFAVATGKIDEKGNWNNLLVNNFYGLNSFSEKGIIASRLPLDLYQGDLNSGQSWYRPSYMLMVILKDKTIPQQYQEEINKKFDDFYKHKFEYNHALSNCSGINLETLRSLGWNIKKEGVESYLKGVGAIPYVTATDSFDSAKKGANYMMTEKTNLYPFVAFNAIGEELLNKIVLNKNLTTKFEKELADQIEAIVYVNIPQFPSSRAEGLAPISSFNEYMARVPEDKNKWKIVPVPPRPFPEELKNKTNEQFNIQPYFYAVIINILVVIVLLLSIVLLIKKFKGNKNV